jgi:hypothetical protein
MRRLSTDYPYTCVTCEAEISGQAVFHVGLPFCCSGCAADGPCNCSYDEVVVGTDPASAWTALTPVAATDEGSRRSVDRVATRAAGARLIPAMSIE